MNLLIIWRGLLWFWCGEKTLRGPLEGCNDALVQWCFGAMTLYAPKCHSAKASLSQSVMCLSIIAPKRPWHQCTKASWHQCAKASLQLRVIARIDALVQCRFGAMTLWCIDTLVQWRFGAMTSLHQSGIAPKRHCTKASWNQCAKASLHLSVIAPKCHDTNAPKRHCTKASLCQSTNARNDA